MSTAKTLHDEHTFEFIHFIVKMNKFPTQTVLILTVTNNDVEI